jgi:hypothetical protein
MGAQLYAAIAGGENCAYRILDNAKDLIHFQGDDEKTREILDKQLVLMNIAMAAMLALRNTLPAIDEGEVQS